MNLARLLRWQWDGYSRAHGSSVNLWLHIVAVPLFMLATLSLLVALFGGSITLAVVSVLGMFGSLAIQGYGHRTEQHPPAPFTGPLDTLARIFLEQWVTFPMFVLSGGWARALDRASRRDVSDL